MFFKKIINMFKGNMGDALTHSEAVIYLLKSNKKEMYIKDIFDNMNKVNLRKSMDNIMSLYSTLSKLKYKGKVNATRPGYWEII